MRKQVLQVNSSAALAATRSPGSPAVAGCSSSSSSSSSLEVVLSFSIRSRSASTRSSSEALASSSTGSIEYYLADYRSANTADHYIRNAWDFVDLSALGTVDTLQFTLETNNDFTPSYIAIDNIGVVPEPSAYALMAGVFCLGFAVVRRRG